MKNVVKRKSPKETIKQENNPSIEHSYVKLGGRELINIGENASNREVTRNLKKINSLWKTNKKRPLTYVHTHPYDEQEAPFERFNSKFFNSMPSKKDLSNFLMDDQERTMIIAQTDNKSGEVLGYFVLRKNKETPKIGFSLPTHGTLLEKIKTALGIIPSRVSSDIQRDLVDYSNAEYTASRSSREKALKNLADKYHLNYRFVRGSLPEVYSGRNYHKIKKSAVESLGAIIAIVGFLGLILFLFGNLTGNVISVSQTSYNFIGVILFITGLVGAFVYFKRTK